MDLFFDGGLVAVVLVRLKIRLQRTSPKRVVWPRPAVFVVVHVPYQIELQALTWWGGVKGKAASQVNTGNQDVDMQPAVRLFVHDGGHVVVLRLQTRERQRLEVRQHRIDLIWARRVLGSP